MGSLLGCEGAGSAAYFNVFDKLIKCNWPHGFSKRVRRPPTDPVNALLSYGYVILTSQVASILAGVGFDPYIGYLHASRYGKPALALDLMEVFRPIIVDSVVLSLLNNRKLSQSDFILELNSYRMTEAFSKAPSASPNRSELDSLSPVASEQQSIGSPNFVTLQK